MDKNSKDMLKQVLGALSHMKELDAQAESDILAEIERINKKEEPKPKKKENAVEKPVENLEIK